MKSYKRILEILADLEHQQWENWSKSIAKELNDVYVLLTADLKQEAKKARKIIGVRLAKWKANWKPYAKLPDHIKELDRKWAEKIYDLVPIKCPVWQCGGVMKTVERKPPKDIEDVSKDGHYEYDGDEQTPDMVCINCGAKYRFDGFKNKGAE